MRLRSKLAENNGLISGGFAVHFFDRVKWDSDLDIFAPQDFHARAIRLYLEDFEGYKLVKKKDVGDAGRNMADEEFYDLVTEDVFRVRNCRVTHIGVQSLRDAC